ncbi:response regulator transcription factor [soil metagenome]
MTEIGSGFGQPARAVDRRPRVVLLAEQRLVGDAVRAALTSRKLHVVNMPWPDGRRPTLEVRKSLSELQPNAGVLFGDFRNPRRRAHARMLVTSVPLRWVLVVSHHADATWGDLVAAGATLLPSSISLEDLSRSLIRLMSGGELMPRQTRDRMVRDWLRVRHEDELLADRLDRLTPREAEVLELLASGISVKDIAVQDGVAEGTVRTQVKAVLRKLEVNSQLAAVAIVRRTPSIATLPDPHPEKQRIRRAKDRRARSQGSSQ